MPAEDMNDEQFFTNIHALAETSQAAHDPNLTQEEQDLAAKLRDGVAKRLRGE